MPAHWSHICLSHWSLKFSLENDRTVLVKRTKVTNKENQNKIAKQNEINNKKLKNPPNPIKTTTYLFVLIVPSLPLPNFLLA